MAPASTRFLEGRELGVRSWGLGKKRMGGWGDGGMGEEEGSWELGVRIWGRRDRKT
uniref:Uncharacterized protein n=1 Tax=Desertifilum tharense IPPAS B-1220 TaxID=1781255 RepID=A0ACD5GZD0_9CYAN